MSVSKATALIPTDYSVLCTPITLVSGIILPPSITLAVPVMYSALSPAKNATRLPICSGVPSFLTGTAAAILSITLCGLSGLVVLALLNTLGVNIKPGHTALQVIPYSAYSEAIAFVKPIRAAFVAA